jgi:membrane protease YdiL (CAAX protease family)
MPGETTKKPLLKPGWLRVLLFGIAFCLVALIIAIPFLLAILAAHKDQLRADPVKAMADLANGNYLWVLVLLEVIVSVICVVLFRLFIDRKNLMSLGLGINGFAQESLIGLILGPALMGAAAILMRATGHVDWTDIDWNPSSLFVSFGWLVLIALAEELVFRGYILANLMDSFGNKYLALGLSAFCFALFHISHPGFHTLAFLNLFLAGMLLGINYIHTRNLSYSVWLHLSWNFVQGPVLGFAVSGLTFPSILQADTKGDLMLTGGDFGLEGSILATVVCFTALGALIFAFERKYNTSATAAQSL